MSVLAGGEPNQFGSSPALLCWEPSPTPPCAMDIASRAPACSARQFISTQAVRPSGSAGREAPRGSAVVTGLAHPIHLGHAESVWVQSARHRHQSRNCPSHHSVGGTEGRQRQQFTVHNGCEHRRRHRVPPVTTSARSSRRRPTSVSGRGRPSPSSSAISAAASACSRAMACSGARCQTPTNEVAPPSSASDTRSAPASTGSGPASDNCRDPPSRTDDARAARNAASAAFAGHPRRLARCRCARPSASPASAQASATPGSSASGANGSAAVTPAHASRPLSPSVATFGAHDAPPAERAVTCRPDHLSW